MIIVFKRTLFMRKNIVLIGLTFGVCLLTNCFASDIGALKNDIKIPDTMQLMENNLKQDLSPAVTKVLNTENGLLNIGNTGSISLHLYYDRLNEDGERERTFFDMPLELNIAHSLDSTVCNQINNYFYNTSFTETPVSLLKPFTTKIKLGNNKTFFEADASFTGIDRYDITDYNTRRCLRSGENLSKICFQQYGQPIFHTFKVTKVEPIGDKTKNRVYFDAKVQLWGEYNGSWYRGFSIMSSYFDTINSIVETPEQLDLSTHELIKAEDGISYVVDAKDQNQKASYKLQQGQFVSKDGFVYNKDGVLYLDSLNNAVQLKFKDGHTKDIEIVTTSGYKVKYPCDIKISGTLGNAQFSIVGSDGKGDFKSAKYDLTNAYHSIFNAGSFGGEKLMRGPVDLKRINGSKEETLTMMLNTFPNNGYIDVDPAGGMWPNPEFTIGTSVTKKGLFDNGIFATVKAE